MLIPGKLYKVFDSAFPFANFIIVGFEAKTFKRKELPQDSVILYLSGDESMHKVLYLQKIIYITVKHYLHFKPIHKNNV